MCSSSFKRFSGENFQIVPVRKKNSGKPVKTETFFTHLTSIRFVLLLHLFIHFIRFLPVSRSLIHADAAATSSNWTRLLCLKSSKDLFNIFEDSAIVGLGRDLASRIFFCVFERFEQKSSGGGTNLFFQFVSLNKKMAKMLKEKEFIW